MRLFISACATCLTGFLYVGCNSDVDNGGVQKTSNIDIPHETVRNADADFTNSIGVRLALIPKGTFTREQSPVTISQDYYLGVYEVTQAQYEKVMGDNPSRYQGIEVADADTSNHPVENISWDAAVEFCKRLSELPEEQAAGRVYRLPTEAEWEYACRAGSQTEFSFGISRDDGANLREYGWFVGNSEFKPHAVGQKIANAWGLHDMHGNVWEWCSDWHGEFPPEAVTDPTGPSEGSYRVYRGGSWYRVAEDCGSAKRFAIFPSYSRYDFGFRIALSSSGIAK